MGDARRRRLLQKPFPPVVVLPDQPGHRYRCFAAKEPVTPGIRCGCDVYARLDGRRRLQASFLTILAAAISPTLPESLP